MNTNALKSFAQAARNKLKEQIAAKLIYLLDEFTDTAELRGKEVVREKIKRRLSDLQNEGRTKEQAEDFFVEEIAYIWFNRLIALRFMDANNFHPFLAKVITPVGESSNPEILDQVKRGIIDREIISEDQLTHIFHILDNNTLKGNSENKAYRIILVAVCNYLYRLMPFLFEGINDYTELLLPNDLTSPHSIIADVVQGMSDEDCKEVEILGWLYQYYVSEENERIISSRKKYTKEDLAPVSQLFTPKWIVKYLVDNTLGRLWSEMHPETQVLDSLHFYIKPQTSQTRTRKKLEDIKIIDPCVGSAHILSYAFDVLYKMYEEEGYSNRDIPFLILKYNLWGVDIDPRAAQIASFVLMMKGRFYYRRFFSKIAERDILPNIYYYKDFEFDDKFSNAKALGSIISVEPKELEKVKRQVNPLFKEEQIHLESLYNLLGQRYDVVVTNPPYINSSRLESSVKKYINDHYKSYSRDLFSVFIVRCLELCNEGGLAGYMTPMVWMFIQSYQNLREFIISNHTIDSLIQLAYDGFSGATVPICTFTLRKQHLSNYMGSYIRLSDFAGPREQAPKAIEAIQNPNCGWFYTTNQSNFKNIPGCNIGYWVSEKGVKIFKESKALSTYVDVKQGLATADNNRFLRLWPEIGSKNMGLMKSSIEASVLSNKTWFPYNKGGSARKWYGNQEYVVNWKNDGQEIRNFTDGKGKLRSRPQNTSYYFQESISWGLITSSTPSFRYYPPGFLFDVTGMSIFGFSNKQKLSLLGALNTKLYYKIGNLINPTLALQAGNVAQFPYNEVENKVVESLVQQNISISKIEWDSRETSWDFQQNELVRQGKESLKEAYEAYEVYWTGQFYILHKNEEELNREFIAIYGLEEELTPEVPIEQITILKDEAPIKDGRLTFNLKEVMKQLVSYGVGCIMGRYSLDKEGLILASQGETIADYYNKVGLTEELVKLQPVADGIVPVLEEESFENDVVKQFETFMEQSFGTEHLHSNLNYLQRGLGRSTLRDYFVRDFYKDHTQRYQNRPIYWMLSSPKGAFRVLIYLHRYTPDTLNEVLNNYLHPYIQRIENEIELQEINLPSTSGANRTATIKRIDELKVKLEDCVIYSKELYDLAVERINLDLDDGVLVNYNKLGNAVEMVRGINDKTKKASVRKFEWIKADEIR